MSENIIFLPLFAQILLTLIVWISLYAARIAEMKAKKIHPQLVANATELKKLLIDSANPANNFINLFEIPVLFYILTIVIFITHTADVLLLSILSLFVISRYVHSYIQITYNKVMHRFRAYAFGTICIWIGWGVLAVKLYN